MKTTLVLALLASALLSGCQTAAGTRSSPINPAILRASPDMLGGLVGQEALSVATPAAITASTFAFSAK